jgi:GTPase SAR1 family protein
MKNSGADGLMRFLKALISKADISALWRVRVKMEGWKQLLISENHVDHAIKLRNFDLVSDALKAESVKSDSLEKFKELIDTEFIPFCSAEPAVNSAETLQKLQFLLKEMRLVANFPSLHSKTVGAIGGGFSSGKSSFINSFIKEEGIRLAEGMLPVTAIPSYVVHDSRQYVNGITYKGGRFEIALDMYKTITHELLKSFSFNLKEIILYTTVLCPMDEELFGSICLIDTPGYNPAASGAAESDFSTASEYIKDANFLIWMIGLDVNGTFPKSDLAFLEKLPFGKERALYVVANKAELKNESDLNAILDSFEESLDDYDIQYSGISAYSSKRKQVYVSRKADIYQFLKDYNRPSRKYGELTCILDGVFQEYTDEIKRDDKEKETKRKEIQTLLLDAFEGGKIGFDEVSNKLEEGLNDLISYFRPQKQKERIERVEGIHEKFGTCLDDFCEEMGIARHIAPDAAASENLENPNAGEKDSESDEYNALLNRWSQGKEGVSALSDVLSKMKTK